MTKYCNFDVEHLGLGGIFLIVRTYHTEQKALVSVQYHLYMFIIQTIFVYGSETAFIP